MDAVRETSTFTTGSSATDTTKKKATEDPGERFLKLLITSMKNQDPLNPMDNAQVTSQIAQISTVSGIAKLNTTLQNMAASFSAGQSVQAANMIGRGVLVPGSAMQLQNGMAVAGVELGQSVDQLTVTIRDAAGAVLQSMDLGPQQAGIIPIGWDGATNNGGPAPNGTYSFSVSALQGDKKIDAATLSYGMVNSVAPGTGGVVLDVGGLGAIGLADVKKIL